MTGPDSRAQRVDASTDPVLNRVLLPNNVCFGCGLENHAGLGIEVVRDPAAGDRLRASFTPTAGMIGFPGIVHGGLIFTALDCLSTWVAILLGPDRHAAWVLRSASATYHKPASAGETLSLSGWIAEQGESSDPLVVHLEARRPDGALCVEGDFKVVPLKPERLVEIAGLDALPENWRNFLDPHPDSQKEIVSSRLIDAPTDLVYRAFIDPDRLREWWGPAGFVNTFDEFDPRPGGAWRFTMRAPDDTEFRMDKRFVELLPNERIVLDHVDPVHAFRMTMTFAEEGAGTRVTWHTRFESLDEARKVRDAFSEGNEQNFDRLEEHLGSGERRP